MKKLVLFATVSIFSLSLMAQGDAKPQTPETRAQKVKPQSTKPVAKSPAVIKAEMIQQAQAQTPVQDQPSPDAVIKVNTIKHDFGKIKQGVPVTYSFELKNTSDKPVVVENTYASCGCTTPEKIVEPIAPGATAKLKVQYNAANLGQFNKDVHIKLAGIAQEKVVQITGEVIQAESTNKQ